MHGLKLYKKKPRFSRIEILSFFSILILSFRCSFCLFFSKFQVIAMDEREPDCCGDNCGENRCNCALSALRCDKTAQTNRCRPWLLGSNFWNEVRCDCKVADHGARHWCQNEWNDQINIVDDRQTEEQRLVNVENARNDCHFAEFTQLVRLGHESHVQNCTKRST